MTFHDLFHDFFKFSKTLGLTVSFKNSKHLLALEHFVTLNSSTHPVLAFSKLIPAVYVNDSSLSYIVLALWSAVTLYQTELKFSIAWFQTVKV